MLALAAGVEVLLKNRVFFFCAEGRRQELFSIAAPIQDALPGALECEERVKRGEKDKRKRAHASTTSTASEKLGDDGRDLHNKKRNTHVLGRLVILGVVAARCVIGDRVGGGLEMR